jgi:hypothetical protein
MKDIHILILSTLPEQETEAFLRQNQVRLEIFPSAIQRCILPGSEVVRCTVWCACLCALTRTCVVTLLPFMDNIIILYSNKPLSIFRTAAWIGITKAYKSVEDDNVYLYAMEDLQILPKSVVHDFRMARGRFQDVIRDIAINFQS